MHSLTPGYRVPAIQRGLSPLETLLTKVNAGAGGAVMASAMVETPPIWAFGVVALNAALLNVTAGHRSIARWAAVGVRHWHERRATPRLGTSAGETRTWTLYPYHGTMQDPYDRAGFHAAFSRALTYIGNQTRSAGIQLHVTHHAQADADATTHDQTISVHIPRNLISRPERVLNTIERELAALGALRPHTPEPVPAVSDRAGDWVALEDGRYAATARITGWPATTDDDLMANLLLDQDRPLKDRQIKNRSLSVLYRPLPVAQARRSARWTTAAGEAFTTDKVKKDENAMSSGTMHDALVHGATLVDIDAYLTVWGESPEDVTQARWKAQLDADERRLRLDWLIGQQHRAHVMTTAHGAPTRKGAIL
ncbi:hypothetical protein [Streptomyces flavofungini]|uniref:hypothetical protein n=1 Tax=Streptomyces flavofungini TaxID=68200 RepID=UPI0025AF23DF|nr:hypothetical protein [Streptomyces flavofungini]WJV51845.1 hypothetical protein QUY26_40770 [Streptomyces flavofungini]WJV51873.1 hypothetical protein QUY26_40575 [Streptomyces flavofungini]